MTITREKGKAIVTKIPYPSSFHFFSKSLSNFLSLSNKVFYLLMVANEDDAKTVPIYSPSKSSNISINLAYIF